MNELLPIVAELTKQYTSGERSSVTYDTSNQLMESPLFTSRVYDSGGTSQGYC